MKAIILFFVVFMVSRLYATPDTIRDFVIESSSGTKVVLTCLVPKILATGSASAGEIMQIELRLDTVSDDITNNIRFERCKLAQAVNRPGLPGTKVTFVVEDLQPNTKYYFACRAKDTEWGFVSHVVAATTGNGTVKPPVDKPPGDKPPTANKTIRVKWTYKEDGGNQPDVVVILHGSTPALTDTPIRVNASTYETLITGLTWGVTHYWQVVTVTTVGGVIKDNPGPLRSNSD